MISIAWMRVLILSVLVLSPCVAHGQFLASQFESSLSSSTGTTPPPSAALGDFYPYRACLPGSYGNLCQYVCSCAYLHMDCNDGPTGDGRCRFRLGYSALNHMHGDPIFPPIPPPPTRTASQQTLTLPSDPAPNDHGSDIFAQFASLHWDHKALRSFSRVSAVDNRDTSHISRQVTLLALLALLALLTLLTLI